MKKVFRKSSRGVLEGTAIDKEEFEETKTIYYHMADLDESGKPLYGKVCELGLEELWH